MLLKPKNSAVFQHYKDRCPPWIKLHRDLLIDRDFMRLPLASKALAPLLWLLASEHKEGIFDASLEELGFRLHITDKEYEQGLRPLIDKGFFVIASGVLAECKQVAIPETETEGERETKREAEAKPKAQRGSRLPQDFLFPKEWADFCHDQRPDLNIQKTFDSFKDFWIAKAGAGGTKLDWFATWRNWVRNQSVPKATFAQINADVARTTVPVNRDYEATQRRLEAEASIQRSGPSLEVLAKMAAIRKSAEKSQ